jgi:Tol biopolymer transport system component
MKRLNDLRMRLVLIGIVTVIVLGGGSAKADFTFGEPAPSADQIESAYDDDDFCVSACGRFLFFGSTRAGGYGNYDLWVATRATLDSDWGIPVNLGPTVNSSALDTDPSISTDGLSLFFRSNRPGGSGRSDLYVATRMTTDDPWGEPINLGPTVNSTGEDSDPSISADGLSLYFSTFQGPRPGGCGGDDIWVTTRSSISDPWGEPINLGPPINTSYNDFMPCISSDGLALFFNSSRPGGFNNSMPSLSLNADIYVAIRRSRNSPWGEPVNAGRLINTPRGSYGAYDPDVSSDGSTIYFSAPLWPAGGKTYDFWQAPIIPMVDFNGDGIVDSADMCIMVDHWGEDYSLCDIGPMP